MLKYLIIELMGFGVFTVIYCCNLTGIVGFLVSVIGVFLIAYSSYKLFKGSKIIQEIVDALAEIFSLGI